MGRIRGDLMWGDPKIGLPSGVSPMNGKRQV